MGLESIDGLDTNIEEPINVESREPNRDWKTWGGESDGKGFLEFGVREVWVRVGDGSVSEASKGAGRGFWVCEAISSGTLLWRFRCAPKRLQGRGFRCIRVNRKS